MDLIKLTALDGAPVFVNPDFIYAVRSPVAGEAPGANAAILLGDQTYYVREPLETVVSKLR